MASGSKKMMEQHDVGREQRSRNCNQGGCWVDDHYVLNEMTSAQEGVEWNMERVLSVMVHNMRYPVTLKVLQVFGAYGVVQKLIAISKPVCCQVLM